MKSTILIFILTFSLSSFAGSALKAAKGYFENINGKKYEKTWNQSASLFQKALTKEQWSKSLTAVLAPLGKNTVRKKLSETVKNSLPGAPDGEYTIFQFQSSFTNKKSAVETITFKKENGEWKLAGYFIK